MIVQASHRNTPGDDVALRIGEVARAAGVNVQTLRFYERRGLLKPPRRRPSGYRAYSGDAARLVRFIRRAQELGFTLREVDDLLQLREGGAASCDETRALAAAKLEAIAQKLRDLRAMKRALETLVATCGRRSERACPILEALGEGAPPRRPHR